MAKISASRAAQLALQNAQMKRARANMIVETQLLSATSTDMLAAPSRLSSIPFDGTLVMEFQSTVNDASNNFAITIQTPDGAAPLADVIVPAGVTAGGMNGNDKYLLSMPVSAGGHVLVAATETGTAVLFARFTLVP